LKKDQEDLKKEKLKFIEKIKGIDKEIIIPKPKKLTLWQRIKQVLIQS
jgi:hypothetical protein